MKRLLLILFAALAFGCETGSQSSGQAESSEVEDAAPFDKTEPGNSIHADSTTTGGMNQPNQYDTLQ